jgi:hypothetical protein
MRRIKPAGWLAIAVGVCFTLALALTAYKSIAGYFEAKRWETTEVARGTPWVYEPTPTPTPKPTATPTLTPTPKPTATPTLTPTPLPPGWRMETDPITGKEYLAPPPEEEKKIREAFNALFTLLAAKDDSDEKLKKFDLEAAKKNLYKYAAKEIADRLAGYINSLCIWKEIGPENPVRCSDQNTCTVMRAVIEFRGAVTYSADMCRYIGESAPCVWRVGKHNITINHPHGSVYVVTLRKEGERWVIVDWQSEALPPLPSSSP